MDISAALAADLATLTQALDDPGTDLETQLRRLVADVKHAVASYLGMRMTIALDGGEITFTVQETAMPAATVATSLRLPVAAVSPAAAAGSLVLYAATPGAFVDLAADLSYALGLDPAALTLDNHLSAPVSGTGIIGLNNQSLINQALGVLIDRGHTPESAHEELLRLAELDSGQLHHAAEVILHSTTQRPPPSQGE